MSEQQQSEATQSRLLDRVRERDIDLLLLSGFFASQPFLAFMLSRIIEGTKFHRIVRARISETDDAGETDVLLLLQSEDDSRLAVMIENKIGAIFQPSQADRYRQRGEQGVVDGQWDRFRTCLCAPAGYIAAAELGKRWNAYISLEDICKWVGESNDRHLHFVGAILREAIVKHKARLLEISPQATAFWKAYRGLASELLPTIAISRLPESVSVASPWPRFGASSLPPNVWLEHKPQQGRVDLTFSKLSLEALHEKISIALPFDVNPTRVGGSAALRLAVPRVNHLLPFDDQQEEVLSVLAAVERLLAIGRGVISQQDETWRRFVWLDGDVEIAPAKPDTDHD